MLKKENESINPIFLDKDTFQHIMNRSVDTINNLKENQEISLAKISNEQTSLKKLKIQKRELKDRIKFTKRILKSEKRKLRKTNKSLKLKRDYILEISNAYIDEKENYLDSNLYTLQHTDTKKR